jgi:uncharacterized protein DUF6916
MEIGDVTIETFAGREGEAFAIELADATLELTLAEVERMPEDWGRTDQRVPFSVVFHGPLESALPQQIWPLDHADLGRLEVFLVPLGPEGDSMTYQAVFT